MQPLSHTQGSLQGTYINLRTDASECLPTALLAHTSTNST